MTTLMSSSKCVGRVQAENIAFSSGKHDQVHSADVEPQDAAPYSILTRKQKAIILFIAGFAAMFSPLSSFIYYPALKTIARDLHTSVSKVNLTITSYMIISGVVPAMWGNLADQIGRRPVLMAMFTIYIAANIGLALQNSYPALLTLRMLQSLGASATVGIGYGIVGDIYTPAQRGQWMSIAACGPNATPAFGPVLGGILADKAGWPYIFWFLVGFATVALTFILILYPETGRKIAGNGAVPVSGIHRRLLDICTEGHFTSPQNSSATLSRRRQLRIPNPFLSVALFVKPYNFPIMLIYGIFYTDYCILQASLSTLFIEKYHYSTLAAGLIYIPFGVGCFLAALLGGRILTRDYKATAVKHGWQTVDKVVGDDLMKFPIVEARLKSIVWIIMLTASCMIPFGFLLEHEVHPAAPLTLQFILGATTTFVQNVGNTILVDLHPKRPATAQASVNLIRCSMAGAALAALQPLINTIGAGWCFVVFAGLTLTALLLWWIEMRWALEWWRRSSEAKAECTNS